MAWRKERIERVEARAYTIPTDAPEADGTFAWKETTIVVVEATGGRQDGPRLHLRRQVGRRPDHERARRGRARHGPARRPGGPRGAGRQGPQPRLGPGSRRWRSRRSTRALWDLKARLLDLPLCKLFGQARESVPVYGSGGFTTYTTTSCRSSSAAGPAQGIPRVKMKVGSEPERDLHRVRVGQGGDRRHRAVRRRQRRLRPQAGALRSREAFTTSSA